LEEKFEDLKTGVIKMCISKKDRQSISQKKKDRQSISQTKGQKDEQ
jgi:hypothetical protein